MPNTSDNLSNASCWPDGLGRGDSGSIKGSAWSRKFNHKPLTGMVPVKSVVQESKVRIAVVRPTTTKEHRLFLYNREIPNTPEMHKWLKTRNLYADARFVPVTRKG